MGVWEGVGDNTIEEEVVGGIVFEKDGRERWKVVGTKHGEKDGRWCVR